MISPRALRTSLKLVLLRANEWLLFWLTSVYRFSLATMEILDFLYHVNFIG